MSRRLALLCMAAATPFVSLCAQAQAFRTYVASYGNDANSCTVSAPCRLLPAALAATVDAGEVWMLDSANFNQGPVDITKSVAIRAVPGQVGSILAVRNAPAVRIATAGVKVALKNVAIGNNAAAPGSVGIQITNGAMLTVEESLFQDLPGDGIWAAGTTAIINVSHSIFRNLGGYGITARDGPTVSVSNSQVVGGSGVQAWGVTDANATTTLSVSDSTLSGLGSNGSTVGVFAGSTSGNARVTVTRSTINYHSVGLLCSWYTGSASLTVSGSTVSGNGFGVEQEGTQAVCASLGNNHIAGNQFDVSANLSTVPLR